MRGILLGCGVAGLMAMGVGSARAAGTESRTAVMVSCRCEDAAGQQYAEMLRKTLEGSTAYRTVAGGADAKAIHIRIVSATRPGTDGERPQTTLEIVCERDGQSIREEVQMCDRMPVAGLVQTLMAELKEW